MGATDSPETQARTGLVLRLLAHAAIEDEGHATDLRQAVNEIEELERRLKEISRVTDVMIGNGPGAVEAYRTRRKGLPTQYWHLIELAREIRKLTKAL